MLWIALAFFCITLVLLKYPNNKNIDNFLKINNVGTDSLSAINVASLVEKKFWEKFKYDISSNLSILGSRTKIYIILYILISLIISRSISIIMLSEFDVWSVLILTLIMVVLGYRYLVTKRRVDFENTFPDALNILMSAVTAGDSLLKAMSYVGDTMDNAIGREFKLMSERLKIGDAPEKVLQRSCKNYPYPEFLFFTLTLRANISCGGQLKGILAKLIRVLIDSRTLEKKKMAMTSEARISAKIVAAIPFVFMIIMNYINPNSVDFVLNDPQGKYILYYVVGSEFIGLGIVLFLVRRVRI